MIKRLSFLGISLLAACSHVPTPVQYQLPDMHNATKQVDATVCATPSVLWVKGVTVAPSLAGSGMLYQTDDVSYVTTQQNLWASPLADQLLQRLMNTLRARLPCYVITTAPMSSAGDSITVHVTHFNGRYDGHVVISGMWLLQRQDKLRQQPFYVSIAQQGGGYAPMVRALNQGWQQISNDIAGQLSLRARDKE